ncbi:MAG: imidazole glycerol phosphate synthase subunit HisH [Nitrospirae bacterium]|nr:imidazole glycerol phosphate synthase subunit HisH [Nitrospirota bacterium]
MATPRVAVVDYGVVNLRSMVKALERLGARVVPTQSRRALQNATAIVLPGVGHFGAAARNLDRLGLVEPLKREIRAGKPFLGVCLGLQLLFEGSDEAPGIAGLGVLLGRVRRLRARSKGLKLPHMGWNAVRFADRRSGRTPGRTPEADSYFYFVHTYAPVPADDRVVLGRTRYGQDFVSAVAWENVLACQFHPEKSQATGLRFLQDRFLRRHDLIC